MDFVKDFQEFKTDLKNKFLDYCEANKQRLQHLYPNTQKLPPEYTLAVVSSLEPKVIEWLHFYLLHVSKNNSESEVINFLELHFDYQEELKIRAENRQKAKTSITARPLSGCE